MTPRGVCYILLNCYKRAICDYLLIILCDNLLLCLLFLLFQGERGGSRGKEGKKEKEVRKRGKKGESSKDRRNYH